MPIIKNNSSGMINNSSSMHGATIVEKDSNIIKNDNRNAGKDFVRTSLDDDVKGKIKTVDYTAPATVEKQKRNTQSHQRNSQNTQKNQNQYNQNESQNIQFSGSAAPASFVSSTDSIIKDDKKEVGKDFVKTSMEDNVKEKIKSSNYVIQPKNIIKAENISRKRNHRNQRNSQDIQKSSQNNNPDIQRSQTESLEVQFSGSAAPASYVSSKDSVIKDDTKGIGKEFVKASLENNIRDIIKADSKSAITKDEKAIEKLDIKNSKKGFVKTLGKHAYRELEAATTSVDRDIFTDRVASQSVKYMVRVPRYSKNVFKATAATASNIRYLSQVSRDLKGKTLTGKEASLLLLKRSKTSLHAVSRKTVAGMARTIEEFYGSDDLGIEAIRKPKDVVVNTTRTIKITNRAIKRAKETPERAKRTLRNIQKNIQKTKQAAQTAARYANIGIRKVSKILANPAVIKSIAIAIAIGAGIMLLIAGVSASTALFSSFTYVSNDEALTDTYVYVTELDTALAEEIANVTTDPRWKYIDKFHVNAFPPQTDPVPILSYLTVRYEDFKFNSTIKSELERIHSDMYKITYHKWIEYVKYPTWTDKVYHLDVGLESIPWATYVETHKSELFNKKDGYAQYQTYNNVGGTTLRAELGFPFLGENVYVSSRFGYRLSPMDGSKELHRGIDIPMPDGTPINAAMSGKIKVGHNGSYGNYVEITSKKRKTLYAHCATIKVANGQNVKKGDVIATVGSTGSSTGSHLHMEFEKNGKLLNPFFYIEREQFARGVSGGFAGAAKTSEEFAAIILEAEKYLGYPYVFGGKTPSTSFDCSGFVSWVYTHSGVKTISADAQGLYNACTPISGDQIKEGDLIFFQNTYDTPNTVTHVAIYVGDGMMLHAGNPIGYTSFNTPYWNKHFYSYGRFN